MGGGGGSMCVRLVMGKTEDLETEDRRLREEKRRERRGDWS
jgi:hypothetical protein